MLHKPKIYGRRLRPITKDPKVHLFAVGEMVRLQRNLLQKSSAPEVYRITARLPARADNVPQYRIRSENETHERVAVQDDLLLDTGLNDRASETLAERTFGHG